MACDCTTYICQEVWLNPCTTGTDTGITATEDGVWTARLGFNGVWRAFGVSVESGEDIAILTALLNENYVHELRLYKLDGSLFNCYHLKTRMTFNVNDADIPSPVAPVSGWDWDEVEASGNTVEINATELSPIIWLDSNPINWDAAGITFEDGVLEMSAIGGFTGTISYQYK